MGRENARKGLIADAKIRGITISDAMTDQEIIKVILEHDANVAASPDVVKMEAAKVESAKAAVVVEKNEPEPTVLVKALNDPVKVMVMTTGKVTVGKKFRDISIKKGEQRNMPRYAALDLEERGVVCILAER